MAASPTEATDDEIIADVQRLVLDGNNLRRDAGRRAVIAAIQRLRRYADGPT